MNLRHGSLAPAAVLCAPDQKMKCYLILHLHCLLLTAMFMTSVRANMRFSRANGYRIEMKEGSALDIIVFHNCSREIKCAARCLDDNECNGYNYHQNDQICEIIPYTESHQLSADNSEWSLWLPDDCPSISQRPDFTESEYSVIVDGIPVIENIYCWRGDSSEILAYLNLPAGASNNIHHGRYTEMMFSKYGIDLDTLTIRQTDVTFSTITKGTDSLPVGFVDNCSGCGGYTTDRSKIKFNIRGTQFMFQDDVTVKCTGYIAYSYYRVVEDQWIESHCTACCGESYVRNGDGDINGQITLKLV